MKNYKIEKFRSLYNWKNLDKKYFTDLDFMDIEHNIKLLNRKKEIPEKVTMKEEIYSIAYFDKNGNLLRIDKVGNSGVPTETYLIWEKGLLKQVFTFRLGYRFRKKLTNKKELYYIWEYQHDEMRRITKMIAISLPDSIYYDHGRTERHCRFEYDKKGLFRIYQTVIGIDILKTNKGVLIYERGKKIE